MLINMLPNNDNLTNLSANDVSTVNTTENDDDIEEGEITDGNDETPGTQTTSKSESATTRQADRVAGGFWAKLAKRRDSLSSNETRPAEGKVIHSKLLGNKITANRMRWNRADDADYVPWQDPMNERPHPLDCFSAENDARFNHAETSWNPETADGTYFEEILSEYSEARDRDRRVVFDPYAKNYQAYHGYKRLPRLSRRIHQDGHEKKDDEELDELQLRLLALQSTIKRNREKSQVADTSNKETAVSDTRKSLPKNVNAKADALGRVSGTNGTRNQPKMMSGVTPKKKQKKRKSAKIGGVSLNGFIGEPSTGAGDHPSRATWQRWDCQRILRISDPDQQIKAFMEMVAQPRNDSVIGRRPALLPNPPGEIVLRDNHELTNMDLSSDNEDAQNQLVAGNTDCGHAYQSTNSSGTMPGRVTTLPNNVTLAETLTPAGEIAKTTFESPDDVLAQSSNSRPIFELPSADAVKNDDDDEEMAALRELVLQSMVKGKKNQGDGAQLHAQGEPSYTTSIGAVDMEQSSATFLPTAISADVDERPTYSDRWMRLNEDAIPAQARKVVSAHAQSSALLDMPLVTEKTVLPSDSLKRVNTVPVISSASTFGQLQSSDTGALHAGNKKMGRNQSNPFQFVKVIHKPLVITLDSSSDEDDDQEMPIVHQVAEEKPQEKSQQLMEILHQRLDSCMKDMVIHQNSLDEDKKRLRTLASIVGKRKTELRSAEMRTQKLKRELKAAELQSAQCRLTISKFNRETRVVQSRIDTNLGLQQVYERQWKDIEQIMAKHKLELKPKSEKENLRKRMTNVRQLQEDCLRKMQILDLKRSKGPKRKLTTEKGSETAVDVVQKKQKLSDDIAVLSEAPGHCDNVAQSTGTADDSGLDGQNNDIFNEPLRWFRSYKLSPYFRNVHPSWLESRTFSHKLNPFSVLCPFDLSGDCIDTKCPWQHEKMCRLTEQEVIADFLSFLPEVVHEQADEKATMLFVQELYVSLRKKMNLNAIISYCLSMMDKQAGENGTSLGVVTEPRSWSFVQNVAAITKGSLNPNKFMWCNDDVEQMQRRYFADTKIDQPSSGTA